MRETSLFDTEVKIDLCITLAEGRAFFAGILNIAAYIFEF